MRNKNQFLNNLKFILWQFVFFFFLGNPRYEAPSLSHRPFLEYTSVVYNVAITRIEGIGNIVEVTRLYINAYFNACVRTAHR